MPQRHPELQHLHENEKAGAGVAGGGAGFGLVKHDSWKQREQGVKL